MKICRLIALLSMCVAISSYGQGEGIDLKEYALIEQRVYNSSVTIVIVENGVSEVWFESRLNKKEVDINVELLGAMKELATRGYEFRDVSLAGLGVSNFEKRILVFERGG